MRGTGAAAIIAITILTSLMAPAAASADQLNLRARILPWAKVETVQHVTSCRISPQDIQRGYLDIPGFISVQLRSNSNQAVRIMVTSVSELQIRVKSADSQLYGQSVTIPSPNNPHSVTLTKLDSRLYLPAGSHEGEIPLTIQVTPEL
ncbi:MAG TPA: hypothetical protein VFR01_05385 [Geobacterales bacterium]|nr:hypothetical protein [Geobacterales bacterium]